MSETMSITFDQLPDARNWTVGKKYHVKMVLQQVSMGENSAEFKIIDATSMEDRFDRFRKFLSGEGSYLG